MVPQARYLSPQYEPWIGPYSGYELAQAEVTRVQAIGENAAMWEAQ